MDEELVEHFVHAAYRGDYNEVVRMVNSGMPAHICSRYGSTALHHSATTNYSDIVEFLLKRGADVDKQNSVGNTALHQASLKDSARVVRVLLQHGASTNLKNKHGRKAIDEARKRSHEDVVLLLEQY